MLKVTIEEQLHTEIEQVWNLVTDLKNYQWRRDLSRIEVIEEGKTFIEYGKNDFATTFHITCIEPKKRYEFDIENKNMKGHWTGIFTENKDGVLLTFTEELTVFHPIMKLLAKGYIKKQQATYMKDVKQALAK